jgi:DNA polymerase-3 subunit alpha (Gram-positive type)
MILFDQETTGLVLPLAVPLARQPRIIEFTAIKLDNVSLKQRACISFLINPGIPIPEEIVRITGITNEMVKKEPTFGERFEEIADFYESENELVAHNLDFDRTILFFALQRLNKHWNFPWPRRHICTVEASFSIHNRRLKLSELYQLATGKELKGAHRSLADTQEGLAESVRWLIQKKKLIRL